MQGREKLVSWWGKGSCLIDSAETEFKDGSIQESVPLSKGDSSGDSQGAKVEVAAF